MKKTFLLGIGAQKAGTTWLHKELTKNTCFKAGFVKEYHTFDSMYAKECIHLPSTWEQRVHAISGMTDGKSNRRRSQLLKRLLFATDSEAYFDYFDYLSIRDQSEVLTGDITPSYSLLDRKAFRSIRKGLKSRGFTIKVVFLMRDPVERIWSALRMNHSKTHEKSNELSADQFEKALTKFYQKELTYCKTDYKKIILNLESVFKPQELHFDFYERLFTPAAYQRFSDFIEFTLKPPDFGNFVNASPKNSELSKELSRAIAQHYSQTYQFVEERFNGIASELWAANYQSISD